MNERRYERLIGDLEVQAANHPGVYRLQALAVSVFAYLALLLILCLLGGILWGVLGFVRAPHSLLAKIGLLAFVLPMLPIFFVVVRMFALRLTPARGIEITALEAPRLFKLLGQIRQRLDGPPIDRVVISNEFNAAIEQLPRFGFFGAYRNHLIIGLPMAFALSGKELAGVIAHEYGHLSGNHGKLSGWIYRQRRTFGALMEHSEQRREDGWLNQMLYTLLAFFAPYYNAVTFVLSRQNEYEADAAAVTVVGNQRFVSGMIRTTLAGRWLAQSFWPKLYAQAKVRDKPLFMPFTALPTALRAGSSEWSDAAWLRAAWQQKSGLLDTHPCLRERVEAQAGHCLPPQAVRETAADALLGPLAKELAQRFDAEWWTAERPQWQRYYRESQRDSARLEALAALDVTSLPAHELQEYALLLFGAEQRDQAKEVLQRLLARSDDVYAKPTMLYGRVLLAEDNETGLAYLEKALKLAPSLAEECIHAGCNWLYQQRGETAADDWYVDMQGHLEAG